MLSVFNRINYRNTFFALILILLPGKGATMEKIHTTQPEAVVFLELAVREMERYKKIHGNYPSEWYLMDITFANGPYRITDDGIRPVKDMKNIWKPKNSRYTYKLKSINKNEFSISAVNNHGVEEYVIEQGMNTPQMK